MRLRASFCLSVALAVLLATLTAAPASAQETVPTESSAGVERSTAKQAKSALRIARRARKIARRAFADVAAAAAAAEAAQTTANAAQAAIGGLAVDSATVAGSASTTEETDYVSLGGPSVQATVGPSGLVEVWATVRFDDPSDGQVALYEDGQRVPILGQDGLCSNGSPLEDVLLSASGGAGIAVTLSTPSAPLFGLGCGTPGGVASPILLERSPGQHTYELRYADCGCEPAAASFSDRTLRVAARP